MQEPFKRFSVKILDYYNITVHSLVRNKLRMANIIWSLNKEGYDGLYMQQAWEKMRKDAEFQSPDVQEQTSLETGLHWR